MYTIDRPTLLLNYGLNYMYNIRKMCKNYTYRGADHEHVHIDFKEDVQIWKNNLNIQRQVKRNRDLFKVDTSLQAK